MAFEPWSAVAGAAVGATATVWSRWWQYRRDNWLTRVDYFCERVDAAAVAATDYWLSEIDITKDPKKESALIGAMECKILGLQATIDGIFPSIAHRISYKNRCRLKELLLEFSDVIAGGDFQVHGRPRDHHRALSSQSVSSDVIVSIRRALDQALTARGLYTYFLELPAYRK